MASGAKSKDAGGPEKLLYYFSLLLYIPLAVGVALPLPVVVFFAVVPPPTGVLPWPAAAPLVLYI